MAEEKEGKEEEREEEPRQPAPQSHAEFLSRHFSKLVLLLAGLFAATYFPVDEAGRTFLSVDQMVIGLALLLVAFVVVPGMLFFRKKAARLSEIEPLNPLREKQRFEQEFRDAGMDVKVLEALPEPYEGPGSDQPFTTHFLCEQQLADGSRKPFIFRAGNLTRIPIGWRLNTRYLENRSYSVAGTRKRPTEVIEVPRPIQTAPQKVQVIIPRGGKEVEKEEEAEEEEEK